MVLLQVFYGFAPLAFASTNTWDFSSSSDFTFDNTKIEFSSGQAQLKATSTPAWYSISWTKRKTITVTGSSAGAQTNYQVKITVPYDSDMQADFDDVRFASSDGITLLDYWLESKTNSSTADFWVEVPSIPVSPNTVAVYMYYGNSSASTASNGANAFISGTDFAQDDGFSYRDNGINESYGDSTGQIRSNGGQLSLVGIDRINDSYVANNRKAGGISIIGSVVDSIALNGPEDVLIDGNYAYIPTRAGAKLSVYDISNPASPTFVSSFTDEDLTEAIGIAKNGNTIYLTSWHNHKLLTLDATNPESITKISSIEIGTTEGGGDPDELRKVFYLDGYAYVTHSHDQKLYIVDVSDPASLSITGSVATGDGAFAVFVKGDYAYVGGCLIGSSLKVIDVSNKAAPSVVKTLSSGNYSCTAGFANSGDNLYAVYYSSNTFVTFDISDPANTSQVGILSSASLNSPNRLDAFGNTAYVASAGGDAIVLVNITDPTNPTLSTIMSNALLDQAYGVRYSGGKIFAVGRAADSLVVLDPSTIDEGSEDENVSVSDNFSVRSKFRFTATTAGAWLPVTGISADGSAINSGASSYSLNPIWFNNTLQVIEFFGIGGTYYKQAASAVSTSLNTTYITELKKVGSNATLSVYQTDGTLVGSSVISSLTNSSIDYRWLMPYQNVATNANWNSKTSTQDVYFSFLRNYVSPEPTYDIGSEVNIYASDNPTVQPTSAITFTSLSGFVETSTLNGGAIKYQISNDGGTTWYWYDSGWTTTSTGYTEANTASDINSNISSLTVGDGEFLWRAYFNSDGTQLVQLDNLALTYISDATAPVRSAGLPSGNQSAGTTQVTLSLTTDESATCKYGTTASTAYASIATTFATTGGTSHSDTITGLSNGQSYNYYVRCIDGSSNSNTDDYTISFSVASPVPSGGGGGGWTPPSPSEPESGFKFFITLDTTTTGVIILNFDGGPDADKVAIADNVNFSPATYINYSTSTQWILSQEFGEKTLYVKFSNKYGRYSKVLSDTVIYAPQEIANLAPLPITITEEHTVSREQTKPQKKDTISSKNYNTSKDSAEPEKDEINQPTKLTSRVEVVIVDTNKNPIEGATVTLHSTPRTTTTDKDGKAIFENVEPGPHKLVVNYQGQEGEQEINLDESIAEFQFKIQIEAKSPLVAKDTLIVLGILALVIASLTFLLLKKYKSQY